MPRCFKLLVPCRPKPEEVVVKSWQNSDGQACWELRGFARFLLGQVVVRLGQWLGASLQPCADDMSKLGWDFEAEVQSSVWAARSKGVDDVEGLQHEYTASTRTFFFIILWCSLNRRLRAEKDRSTAFLQMLFYEVVPGSTADRAWWLQLLPEHLATCDIGVEVAGGHCMHVQVFACNRKDAECTGHELIVERLQELLDAAADTDCECLRLHFGKVLSEVVAVAEASLSSRPAATFGDLELNVLRGRKRLLRVDRDFQEACVERLAQTNAMSLEQARGSHGFAIGSTANHWIGALLKGYSTACFQTFGNCKSITMAPDASRLGNPAEDVLVYPCYSADARRGAWGCPQALLGATCGGALASFNPIARLSPSTRFWGLGGLLEPQLISAGLVSKRAGNVRQGRVRLGPRWNFLRNFHNIYTFCSRNLHTIFQCKLPLRNVHKMCPLGWFCSQNMTPGLSL